MAGITLEQAEAKLKLWMDAEDKVSAGQSYTIGTRSLSYANLGSIRDNIKFWNTKVKQLERKRKGKGTARIRNVIPTDY